jgi:hypothetical protein
MRHNAIAGVNSQDTNQNSVLEPFYPSIGITNTPPPRSNFESLCVPKYIFLIKIVLIITNNKLLLGLNLVWITHIFTFMNYAIVNYSCYFYLTTGNQKLLHTLDCFAFVIHADGVRQRLQSVATNGTIVHTSNGINNLHTEFNENLICHSQVIL